MVSIKPQVAFNLLAKALIALVSYAAAANPQEYHQFDCLTNTTELSSTVKKTIPKDTTKFDCSNCPIKILQEYYFADFSSLTDIILTGTLISRIPANAFIGLPKLKFLDLSNNPIGIIENGSFGSLKCLKELRLAGISLHSIPPTLIDGLPELEFLVRPDGVKERLNRGARNERNDVTAAADRGRFTKMDMSDSGSNVTKKSSEDESFTKTEMPDSEVKMTKESKGRYNVILVVFLVACLIVPLGGTMTCLICRKRRNTPPPVPSQPDHISLDDGTKESLLHVEMHEVPEIDKINNINQ